MANVSVNFKMDADVKKEMEYIIKKIYIFQGEVRYL